MLFYQSIWDNTTCNICHCEAAIFMHLNNSNWRLYEKYYCYWMASIKLYQNTCFVMLSSSKELKFVSCSKLILKFKFAIFKNMCQIGCQAMKLQDKYCYYHYGYYCYYHIHSNIYINLCYNLRLRLSYIWEVGKIYLHFLFFNINYPCLLKE